MKSSITKMLGAALLAGTLVTTTYTPFTSEQTAIAKSANTTITQVKGNKGAALYSSVANVKKGKVKNKLADNYYLQIIKTVKINNESYYYVRYMDESKLETYADYVTYVDETYRYIKVSDTKKIKHVYSPLVNIRKAPEIGSSETKRFKMKKAFSTSSVARFDRPDKITYYKKNQFVFKLGERKIDGVPYALVTHPFADQAYVKQSLLVPDNATNVKNYNAKQRKVTYRTTKATQLRDSYGTFMQMELGDGVKKDQKFHVYKEVTYEGKQYVYVKLINAKMVVSKGWLIKDYTTVK